MSQKRHLFIDIFRGWAVIAMIETHAFNAWMDGSLRQTSWFPYLNLVNGFVAPSFLFIAGVSFAFVAEARWNEIIRLSRSLSQTFRRLLMILGLGYWLHLPRMEWHSLIPSVVAEDLPEFFRADVLHTIAVSLILLHVGVLACRKKPVFITMLSLAAVAALLATPALWRIDFFQFWHPMLATYMNGMHNPLFPLFPWCVFVWCGALAGFWFLRSPEDGLEKRVSAIAGAGVLIFVAAYVSDMSSIRVFDYDNFWLASPNWVLMRLGILCVLFAMLWLLEHWNWHTSAVIRRFGSQSLFAYVVHLMIIYSITGEKAGFPILDQDHSVTGTVLLFVILLIVMYFLTEAWAFGKKKIFKKPAH